MYLNTIKKNHLQNSQSILPASMIITHKRTEWECVCQKNQTFKSFSVILCFCNVPPSSSIKTANALYFKISREALQNHADSKRRVFRTETSQPFRKSVSIKIFQSILSWLNIFLSSEGRFNILVQTWLFHNMGFLRPGWRLNQRNNVGIEFGSLL